MNKLTTEICAKMSPKAALIVYQNTENKDGYYIESRPILNGQMGAARPVSSSFINSIVASFAESQSTTPHGIIPPNMLYCDTRKGHERYVWYNSPTKRQMYFTKDLAIPSGEYCVPGLIYEVGKGKLNLYAYAGENAPATDAKLCSAPFFNVSSGGGNVCLGSAKAKKPQEWTYQNLIKYWEDLFWFSEFSHLGAGGNPTKSNLVLVVKASSERFNDDELQPIYQKTLSKLLK